MGGTCFEHFWGLSGLCQRWRLPSCALSRRRTSPTLSRLNISEYHEHMVQYQPLGVVSPIQKASQIPNLRNTMHHDQSGGLLRNFHSFAPLVLEIFEVALSQDHKPNDPIERERWDLTKGSKGLMCMCLHHFAPIGIIIPNNYSNGSAWEASTDFGVHNCNHSHLCLYCWLYRCLVSLSMATLVAPCCYVTPRIAPFHPLGTSWCQELRQRADVLRRSL